MAQAWRFSAPFMAFAETGGVAIFTILMTIGSNVVSNVPLVMLTGPYLHQLGAQDLGWVLLAFTTTVAGNLTLPGSVANIIVAERAGITTPWVSWNTSGSASSPTSWSWQQAS